MLFSMLLFDLQRGKMTTSSFPCHIVNSNCDFWLICRPLEMKFCLISYRPVWKRLVIMLWKSSGTSLNSAISMSSTNLAIESWMELSAFLLVENQGNPDMLHMFWEANHFSNHSLSGTELCRRKLFSSIVLFLFFIFRAKPIMSRIWVCRRFYISCLQEE